MALTTVPVELASLDGAVTVNESSADVDFRVESDGNANMLVVDGGNDRVGVGISPSARLHVDGSEDYTGGIVISAGAQLHSWFLSSDLVNVHNVHSASASAAHTWQVGGTEVTRITPSGLTFNGDTAAANALDDYEEGTWTPVLSGATTAGTFSAGTGTAGRYIKIGKLCYVAVSIRNSTLSSAAGALKISGLPYATYDNQLFSMSSGLMMHSFAFDPNDIQAFYAANDVLNGMESVNGTSWQDWAVTNSSTLYLQMTCVYEVDE